MLFFSSSAPSSLQEGHDGLQEEQNTAKPLVLSILAVWLLVKSYFCSEQVSREEYLSLSYHHSPFLSSGEGEHAFLLRAKRWECRSDGHMLVLQLYEQTWISFWNVSALLILVSSSMTPALTLQSCFDNSGKMASMMERGKAKFYSYSRLKQEKNRYLPNWKPGYLLCCNTMPIKMPFFSV